MKVAQPLVQVSGTPLQALNCHQLAAGHASGGGARAAAASELGSGGERRQAAGLAARGELAHNLWQLARHAVSI